MTDEQIIKALECCTLGTFACGKECPYYSIKSNLKVTSCRFELMCELSDLIKRLKAENDDLFYKLQGVMWFVDKWLDGDELKQDEVIRATIMREKTLQITEKLQAEVERLKALVDEMSGYFPTCIGCEGKTTLGERTDKCVYLVDDTEYCAKRGISNIANIMKENEALKTEIELLRKAKAEDVSRAYKIAKSEAIKEFAEKLTDIICEKLDRSLDNPNGNNYFITDVYKDIDYGSCTWARFILDTENYDMHIISDCGKYGYGWIPTPEHESFLKLMSRINEDYLLDKIASRGTIDYEKTYENIKFFLEQCANENLEDINIDLEELESACNQYTDRDIVDAVCHIIKFTSLNECIEEYELYENIEKDYSASQKKIAEVFKNHIQPFIKEMLDKENGYV